VLLLVKGVVFKPLFVLMLLLQLLVQLLLMHLRISVLGHDLLLEELKR
jgi:hypothetical protein